MLNLMLFLGCFSSHTGSGNDSIPVVTKGHLKAAFNDETSGVAASFINKGLLYIHNDSGDTSRFFLMAIDGTIKAIVGFKGESHLPTGVADAEDIATGPGPLPGKHYVYLGDIGDNQAQRKHITIYRVQEPALKPSGETVTLNASAEPLYLRYPDGARDAETLMIDPVAKLICLVSKREDSVKFYTCPLEYKSGDTVLLTKRATLFFPGIALAKQITAGDISQDGSRVILKSYSKVYYWKRKAKEPVWELLNTTPVEFPYKIEPQGESIGFILDGSGYFTISEGTYQPVYYYQIDK
ncbi:MAG: hypothetical protein H7Y03_02355 [Chitinophagaceae bacterium]|nr:hypothetical protein [Chitinophagaceae bacterium]